MSWTSEENCEDADGAHLFAIPGLNDCGWLHTVYYPHHICGLVGKFVVELLDLDELHGAHIMSAWESCFALQAEMWAH